MSGEIVFVSGTDTGVGKTVAATWLAGALRTRGQVALIKPFQTGATDPARDGDEAVYRATLGETVTLRTLSTLAEPLAPSIAARRAGITLAPAEAAAACRAIAAEHEVTVVEGAGGLLVPITEALDMAAFARSLGASLVVVTRPGLGTLNHTLLTVEAAERRGLPVRLLIVSGYPDEPESVEMENLRFLRERLGGIPLLVLTRVDVTGADFLGALRPRLAGTPPSFLEGIPVPQLEID